MTGNRCQIIVLVDEPSMLRYSLDRSQFGVVRSFEDNDHSTTKTFVPFSMILRGLVPRRQRYPLTHGFQFLRGVNLIFQKSDRRVRSSRWWYQGRTDHGKSRSIPGCHGCRFDSMSSALADLPSVTRLSRTREIRTPFSRRRRSRLPCKIDAGSEYVAGASRRVGTCRIELEDD